MAWELRHGRKRYFYKSVRVGGAVKKIYLGAGPAATEQARLVSERQHQREADRATLAADKARVVAADRITDELLNVASVLFESILLAAGLRRHRGEWRRTRNDRSIEDREQRRRPEGPAGRAEGG